VISKPGFNIDGRVKALFKDPEENTLEQIKKVTSHPWIAKDIPGRGFIFDVETGLLREVQQIAHQAAD
jgi:carbonic anhydrase